MTYPVPSDREIFFIPWPVKDKSLSFYFLQVDKLPESAVITVVPVVSHNKKWMFGNSKWPQVVSRLNIWGEDSMVKKNSIFLILWYPVDIDLFIFDFNGVPFYTDNSFNIVLFRIQRIFEDNNISTFRICYGDPGVTVKWIFYTVDEFIDKYVVTYEEGVFHWPWGDFKGLNHKGPDKKGKQ